MTWHSRRCSPWSRTHFFAVVISSFETFKALLIIKLLVLPLRRRQNDRTLSPMSVFGNNRTPLLKLWVWPAVLPAISFLADDFLLTVNSGKYVSESIESKGSQLSLNNRLAFALDDPLGDESRYDPWPGPGRKKPCASIDSAGELLTYRRYTLTHKRYSSDSNEARGQCTWLAVLVVWGEGHKRSLRTLFVSLSLSLQLASR